VQALLSDDHFSVDGTLIEAWASMKSFKPRDGEASGGDDDDSASGTGQSGQAKAKGRNAERDFHGEKRSNATHASTTDPDARLFKKARGQAARLCHMGHVLTTEHCDRYKRRGCEKVRAGREYHPTHPAKALCR
jgi:hypothetical protein